MIYIDQTSARDCFMLNETEFELATAVTELREDMDCAGEFVDADAAYSSAKQEKA
jgi:hypothetical protein